MPNNNYSEGDEQDDDKLDNIDKNIVEIMLKNGCGYGRWLTTNQIAEYSKINWRTAYTHLNKLKQYYYVKKNISGKKRNYKPKEKPTGNVRSFVIKTKIIESERQIEWTLNVKEEDK